MKPALPKQCTILEPFDPKKHDRTAFSCGIVQVDNFFKNTATKLTKAGNTRIFVLTEENGSILGFYALSAHSVLYELLPDQYGRNRPRNGNIPAVYISMIGVDARMQGRGYGGDLLVDALKRIAKTSRDVGISVVMLDVLDCGNPELVEKRKRLYASYGFQELPSNTLRMCLPIKVAELLIEEENAPAAAEN